MTIPPPKPDNLDSETEPATVNVGEDSHIEAPHRFQPPKEEALFPLTTGEPLQRRGTHAFYGPELVIEDLEEYW
jgi:hypothetical protein